MTWRAIFKAIFLGVFWTLSSVSLGILPAIIRLILSFFSDRFHPMSIEDMLREGLLLGLLLALIGSVCIDWIFSPTHRIETFFDKLLFFVFPVVALVVLTSAYSALYAVSDAKDLNVSKAETFCIWVAGVSMLYCIIAKFLHFLPTKRSSP